MTFAEWLQSALTAHRFSPGLIDGVIGKQTLAALLAFQIAKRLPETGMADAATVAALKVEPEAPPTAQDDATVDRSPEPAPETMRTLWPRYAALEAYYGKVGTNQGRLILPFQMKLAWDTSRIVKAITLHEKVLDSAGRCFDRIADAYDEAARAETGIDLFAGSLNVRRMRGGTSWSTHSWGIAIDFDSIRNQLRWGADKARLAKPDCAAFWQIWEDEGWVSLGRSRNYDWMHVQACRL